jgi:hypothetical protein
MPKIIFFDFHDKFRFEMWKLKYFFLDCKNIYNLELSIFYLLLRVRTDGSEIGQNELLSSQYSPLFLISHVNCSQFFYFFSVILPICLLNKYVNFECSFIWMFMNSLQITYSIISINYLHYILQNPFLKLTEYINIQLIDQSHNWFHQKKKHCYS